MALRYRGHVTNKKHISTFTRPMYPKLSRVVTQDEETPLPKSLDSLISWSRNKLKKRISTFTRPINSKLRSVVFLDEGTPPTKSRDDNSKTYLHFHKDCGSQTQKDTGYSVVITIEVCAEGNWLIQVSAYFYPSLSKKYNISNVKEAIGVQWKACACRK